MGEGDNLDGVKAFLAQYGGDQEEAMKSLLRTERLNLSEDELYTKLFEELGIAMAEDPEYFGRQAEEHKKMRNAPPAEAVGQPQVPEAPAPLQEAGSGGGHSLFAKMASGSKASSKLADLIT